MRNAKATRYSWYGKNAENREYVLVEVAKKGALLEFASKELRNDKEVVLECIQKKRRKLKRSNLKNERFFVMLFTKKKSCSILKMVIRW